MEDKTILIIIFISVSGFIICLGFIKGYEVNVLINVLVWIAGYLIGKKDTKILYWFRKSKV